MNGSAAIGIKTNLEKNQKNQDEWKCSNKMKKEKKDSK